MRIKILLLFVFLSIQKINAQQNRIESEVSTSEPSFSLFQNYPNPAKEFTRIKFQLNTSGQVSLKLFDMLGNPVSTLIDQQMVTGTYSIPVETDNFPNGIYFYVFKKENVTQTMKMVVSK
jgi:hypothetical protein